MGLRGSELVREPSYKRGTVTVELSWAYGGDIVCYLTPGLLKVRYGL